MYTLPTRSKERNESLTKSKQMAISAINNLMLRGLAPQHAFTCVTWGPFTEDPERIYYCFRNVIFEWKSSTSSFAFTKITLTIAQVSIISLYITKAIIIETFDVESGRPKGKMIIEGTIASNIQHNDLQKSILL